MFERIKKPLLYVALFTYSSFLFSGIDLDLQIDEKPIDGYGPQASFCIKAREKMDALFRLNTKNYVLILNGKNTFIATIASEGALPMLGSTIMEMPFAFITKENRQVKFLLDPNLSAHPKAIENATDKQIAGFETEIKQLKDANSKFQELLSTLSDKIIYIVRLPLQRETPSSRINTSIDDENKEVVFQNNLEAARVLDTIRLLSKEAGSCVLLRNCILDQKGKQFQFFTITQSANALALPYAQFENAASGADTDGENPGRCKRRMCLIS